MPQPGCVNSIKWTRRPHKQMYQSQVRPKHPKTRLLGIIAPMDGSVNHIDTNAKFPVYTFAEYASLLLVSGPSHRPQFADLCRRGPAAIHCGAPVAFTNIRTCCPPWIAMRSLTPNSDDSLVTDALPSCPPVEIQTGESWPPAVRLYGLPQQGSAQQDRIPDLHQRL